LLSLLGGKDFQINVSVPLVLEYEEMAKRFAENAGLSYSDIDDMIDYICRIGTRHRIHFLWRPFLKDPHDDMILELAAGAGCDFIVTHNIRDFRDIEQFGVKAITPREFLRIIGGLP
jgi:predicted nucleic acid-binding protein